MKRPATRYAKSTPRSGFRAVLEGTSKICQRFAFVTGFGNHCHRRAARVLCASTIFWTVSVVTIVSVNIYKKNLLSLYIGRYDRYDRYDPKNGPAASPGLHYDGASPPSPAVHAMTEAGAETS